MEYAKYVNESYVEFPPQNMPNRLFADGTRRYVSNYNVATDMLLEDGYVPVHETPMPEPIHPEDSFLKRYRPHPTYIEVYWVNQYVAPTLEEVKAQKIEDINLYRKDDYRDASITYEGNEFPVDDTFFIEVNGSIISQEPTHEFKVKGQNKYVELDLTQMAQLQKLIGTERRAIYDYSQTVKQKIWAAETVEEVNEIAYNRGGN